MATTTVDITVKPERGKFTSEELRNELDNIDALADMNAVKAAEVAVKFDIDYDDNDSVSLVASWTV